MAGMVTTLKEFHDNGDSRTFSLSGHTTSEPRLVIQKRKVPTSVDGVMEVAVKVIYGTTDAEGNLLNQKFSFEGIARGPVKGDATDRDAALVVFRDIIASDEFTAVVPSQDFLNEV
jgi:hypothetical protein